GVTPTRRKWPRPGGDPPPPPEVLAPFGADAVRHWAASKRAGIDTTLDEGQLRVGRGLGPQLLHPSRFVLALYGRGAAEATGALDRAMLAALAGVADEATVAF